MTNGKNRIILVVLLTLSLLAVLSPSLYAFIWHVRHGSRISFRGAVVRVPSGWVAEPGEVRRLDFTKFPALIFGLRDTTSGFGLGQLISAGSRDPEELYKSWETVNWTVWNSTGGVVKGPFTLGTGKNEVVCMTSFSNTANSYGMASCLLFHRTWTAEFIGREKDVDAFLGVIRDASPVEESSTGKQ